MMRGIRFLLSLLLGKESPADGIAILYDGS